MKMCKILLLKIMETEKLMVYDLAIQVFDILFECV